MLRLEIRLRDQTRILMLNLKSTCQRLISMAGFEEGQNGQFLCEKCWSMSWNRGGGSTTRDYLGRALNTLQEFYSHSYWVELGGNDVNAEPGDDGTIYLRSREDLQTCSACKDPACDPLKQGETGGYSLEDAVFLRVALAMSHRAIQILEVDLYTVALSLIRV